MPKRFRFQYDPDGTPANHDFYADRIRVELELDADEYTLLNSAVETDVRKVRPTFVIEAVAETTNASAKTFGQILMDLLNAAATIRFYPDVDNAAVFADVTPDISDSPTFLATRRGVVQRGQTFRLKGPWLDPDDAILDEYAQLTDTL